MSSIHHVTPLPKRLALQLAGLLLLGLCACGRQAAPEAQLPASAPAGFSAFSFTPPLATVHPSIQRRVSGAPVPIDSGNVVSSDPGGLSGPGPGGTFAVIPSEGDDLAWAVFQVALGADDRPVNLNLSTSQAQGAGGPLAPEYWLGLYNFSAARWEWRYPDPERPGPWTTAGPQSLDLNTPDLRSRYHNLTQDTYLAVLVLGNELKHASAASTLGVTVDSGSLDNLNKDDSAYLPTAPLPANLIGLVPTTTDPGQVRLNFGFGSADGANRLYIERRRQDANGPWELIKTYTGAGAGTTTHVDPTDSDDQSFANGTPYEYRAVAAFDDGTSEYRAAASGVRHSPGWHTVTLGGDQTGAECSLIEMTGNSNVPGIAYLDASSGLGGKLEFLSCSYGGDPHDMLDPDKWYGTTIDATEGAGYDCSLTTVMGNPAVAYTNIVSGGVFYARANGFIGAGENVWNVHTVDSNSDAGESTSLAVVGANPAIACCTRFAGLSYYYSVQNDGEQGWMTAVTAASGGGIGEGASLIELPGGLPGISYRDGTKLSFASSPDFDGASGFTAVLLDPTGSFDIQAVTSLRLINGNPAVATVTSGGELWFARCGLDDGGTGVSDWAFALVEGNAGSSLSLAEIGGHPSIATWLPDAPDNFQHYVDAADADGADGQWTSRHVVDNIGPSAGGACSLALVDGWPAMCYQETATHKLRFAVYF